MSRDTIVSLLPAATEIVCALGLRHRLTGRSHACDFPLSVHSLPVLTAPHIDPSRPSGEIDVAVRAMASARTSLYALHESRLAGLAPGLIVTQAACAVCALSEEEVDDFVRRRLPGTELLSLSPVRLGDVVADVLRVARACDVESRGVQLADDLEARLAALPPRGAAPPRVAVLEWLDPPMLAGHWVPEAIERAGGQALGAAAGARALSVGWSDVEALDADVLVVVPCGFDLDRTAQEAGMRHQLRSVADRVLLLDGNATFSRPGPRVVDGIEAVAAFLVGEPVPSDIGRALST